MYHLVDSLSTGIKRVYVGPFAWRDLGLSFEGNKNRVTGFYEDPKSKERIPLPQDIKDELDKNMQDYFIVSVKYNRRNRGTLEGVAAAFWYGKGKVPSQRFQDFFKAYVGKPIEKLDFNYGD